MKTFKNSKFTRRDYECSNVVCCVADSAPAPHWVECSDSELKSLQKLWSTTENGKTVQFWGHL